MSYNYPTIPPALRESLEHYALEHRPTGGFLQAVIENNLAGAVTRGDPESLEAIKDLVWYVHNEMPSVAQGSPEAFKAWTECRCAEAAQAARNGRQAIKCVRCAWPAEKVKASR